MQVSPYPTRAIGLRSVDRKVDRVRFENIVGDISVNVDFKLLYYNPHRSRLSESRFFYTSVQFCASSQIPGSSLERLVVPINSRLRRRLCLSKAGTQDVQVKCILSHI